MTAKNEIVSFSAASCMSKIHGIYLLIQMIKFDFKKSEGSPDINHTVPEAYI